MENKNLPNELALKIDLNDTKTTTQQNNNKLMQLWHKIKPKIQSQFGCILAIFCAINVSLGGIFYKKAVSMSGSDNSIFRYVIQLIAMIIILKYKKIPLLGPKQQRKLLLTRSFFGIFAVVFTNFAIKYIAPSDSSAISHTNIILTAIIARIFLKEKIGIQHLIALLLTVVGVLLMTKPSFIFKKKLSSSIESNFSLVNSTDNFTESSTKCSKPRSYENNDIYDQLIGVGFALIGAIGSGAIHVIIKKLCINKVHFAVNTLYGTFLGLPASIITSIILVVTGSSHSNFTCELKDLPYDIMYGLIGGGFAVFAHVLLNISLQYEDATKVAIVRTTDVVFSFVFQFLILKIKTDYISILGALSILFGTFIILFYKIIEKKFKRKSSKVDAES
jgi:drug/metabolite transporter (DMT)-like permease